MKNLIYISKELQEYSDVAGVEPENLVVDRKRKNVDLRDIFIWINNKQNKDIELTMTTLNMHRTSFYASTSRFKLRYEMYKEYRDFANEIEIKFTGQLKLF